MSTCWFENRCLLIWKGFLIGMNGSYTILNVYFPPVFTDKSYWITTISKLLFEDKKIFYFDSYIFSWLYLISYHKNTGTITYFYLFIDLNKSLRLACFWYWKNSMTFWFKLLSLFYGRQEIVLNVSSILIFQKWQNNNSYLKRVLVFMLLQVM